VCVCVCVTAGENNSNLRVDTDRHDAVSIVFWRSSSCEFRTMGIRRARNN